MTIDSPAYGFNLIHSPNEQSLERTLVDLYLRRNVRLVEASAYLDLTPHVVRYRLHGIHRNNDGEILTPNRVIAKVSRIEVGSKFFAPAPAKMLSHLVEQGALTADQARSPNTFPSLKTSRPKPIRVDIPTIVRH